MGGSGGGSRVTRSGRGGTGGTTVGSGSGGGGIVPLPPDCPEMRLAQLVDVAAAGNGAFALTLLPGSLVALAQDGNRHQVIAEGQTLGWLPSDLSSLLRRCEQEGYDYAATLQSVTGLPVSPQIRVALQRP